MDEASWSRHANPWSVWTRSTALPFLVLACWSRVWIGWWSLVPIAGAVLWGWSNPRLFPPPRSIDNWASKAVLGERIWMNRKEAPIPERHRTAPNVLSAIAAAGAALTIWGVVVLDPCATMLGASLVYLSKFWFLDRMVWLYEDTKSTTGS